MQKKSGKPSIGEENSHIFEIFHVFKNGKVDLRHKYNEKLVYGED